MQSVLGLISGIAVAVLTSSIDGSQAAQLSCSQVIQEFDRFPKSLELIECKPAKSSQLKTLKARYRVEGDRATAVEKFLHREYGLPALRFICCGWSGMTGSENGQPTHGRAVYEDANANYYEIRMMSAETLITDRQQWSDIPWFYVTVTAFLEMP